MTMKIYALRAISWIEDHYEEDSILEDFLFLSKEATENKLNEIAKKEEGEDGYGGINKIIRIEKDDIQYLVSYSDNFIFFDNVTVDNAKDILWEKSDACWYYIQELKIHE